MRVIAIPHGGGGGIERLLRLLFRLAIWHALIHALRGFLTEYTHMPWVGTLVVVIIAVALIQFFRYRRRR